MPRRRRPSDPSTITSTPPTQHAHPTPRFDPRTVVDALLTSPALQATLTPPNLRDNAAIMNATPVTATIPAPNPPHTDRSTAPADTNMTDPSTASDASSGEEGVIPPTDLALPPPPPQTREISALATWTLSSHKPGCGIASLRSSNPQLFWQSDGPQPHTLTLHFFKRVAIVAVRVYLDIEADESYTPTKMSFWAGMSEGGLVEFGSWEWKGTDGAGPRGWISVDLSGVGGRSNGSYAEALEESSEDDDILKNRRKKDEVAAGGDVLKCMVLQVRITENHQNGKDTHVRGFQVFSRDEKSRKGKETGKRKSQGKRKSGEVKEIEEKAEEETDFIGLEEPDWMGEPELR